MKNHHSKFKYSLFNNILEPIPGTKILYNAGTQSLMKLPPEGLPETPEGLSPTVFKLFQNAGFILESDRDEAQEAWEKMIDQLSSNDNFYLIINPTLNCNCRCWYCIETHPIDSRMSHELLEKVKSFILQILPKVKSLTISFFGGEPFLEFERIVKLMMKWCKDTCEAQGKILYFIFTTNGLLVDKKKINFLKAYPNQEYQITLDGHRDSHNKVRILKNGDSYHRILQTIRLLTDNGIRVLVRLNLTHENIDAAFAISEDFRDFPAANKKLMSLTCQQVWQDTKNGELHDQFMEINRRFFEIGIHPKASNYDWRFEGCYGDRLYSAVMNYNGDIYKCSAVEYTGKSSIGNIDDEDTLRLLSADFNNFIAAKQLRSRCNRCSIMPLCMRGCYKRVIINPQACQYPTEGDKYSYLMKIMEVRAMERTYITE